MLLAAESLVKSDVTMAVIGQPVGMERRRQSRKIANSRRVDKDRAEILEWDNRYECIEYKSRSFEI